MVKGKTANGFKFELDADVFDDLELLERINDADKDATVLPALLTDLLGEKQYIALKDFLRAKHGKVRITDAAKEFAAIMQAAGEANKEVKN